MKISKRISIKDNNMRKSFLVGCLVVIISLLLSNPTILNAGTVKLKYKGKEFPVAINLPFPVKASYKVLTLPDSNSLDYYAFTAEDKTSAQIYGISITFFPNSLGEITRQIAQQLVSQTLEVQIETINATHNIKSRILKENSTPLAGYPSKYITLVRDAQPKLFSCYRGVFFNRLLVVAWSTGLDFQKNRNLATEFIKSLKLSNNHK